ncbi:MAG: hypothetical protein J6Y85_03195 [Alphaproteobacteria bacterium]|nr:hypothetical protein [Alphaproteobacteria bacterium]
MKKNIFVLALSLTFATAAHAETTIEWTQAGCQSVGGTWITAHSASDEGCDAAHCNGLNFCKSTAYMNWFSALIWCKSIGRNLADANHVCPGVPLAENSNARACLNVTGTSQNWGWTTLPGADNKAFHVNLNSGPMGFTSRSEESSKGSYALCE